MDRKLQRHRADSLRQHGFLVYFANDNRYKLKSTIQSSKSQAFELETS